MSERSKGFEKDDDFILKVKNEMQAKLQGFGRKEIKHVPDFLVDRTKKEERIEVLNKLKKMLNLRFFLIDIADILETNDYDRIDSLLQERTDYSATIQKYNQEEGKDVKTFLRLKPIVGDNNARIYAEQEEKLRTLIDYMIAGKYLRKSRPGEEAELLEDNISNIIDNPDFNRACQIEASYVDYEITRVLSEIKESQGDREYLTSLIDKLETLSAKLKSREDAFNTINALVTGNTKPVLSDNTSADKKIDEGR